MSSYYKDEHRYDDIINLPHYRSKERIPMSLHDRAAQFAGFRALTGHEEAIEETARLTDAKIELDESAVEKINEKLYELSQKLSDKKSISITYFKPDSLKLGGAYLTDIGTIKKLDANEHIVMMDSGMKIPMNQIINIEIL